MLSDDEIDSVMARTASLWPALANANIFVTGGTGFFGQWMLSLLSAANQRLNLKSKTVVLTRDRIKASAKLGTFIDEQAIEFQHGNLEDLETPSRPYQFVLHLAGEPHGPRYAADPIGTKESMVNGTRSILNWSRQCGQPQFLLISSGAVYGHQPGEATIAEDCPPKPDPSPSRRAYAEAKRCGEEMALASGLPVKIARPFAFLGPALPLDASFAASQMIADGLKGDAIRVNHGSVVRSYLDGLDLAVWLWTTLIAGQRGRVYNIGSEEATSLRELGGLIASACGVDVSVQDESVEDRYVPCTRRAREELKLTQTIDLKTTVTRTVQWHRCRSHAAPCH